MKKLICKICRKEMALSGNPVLDKMMEIMDLPEDSGAHAECLGIDSGVRANTEPSRELAQDAPKSNVGDNSV